MELTDRYFGPDGTAIDYDEWSRLFELRAQDTALESWWRRQTRLDDKVEVSTVWIGLVMSTGGPPLIWESMIFGGNHDGDQWRYASRAEALDHHENIVRALREDREP